MFCVLGVRDRCAHVVLRQITLAGVCVGMGLVVLAAPGGDAVAQSFFEKLFGLGDSRPTQPALSSAPRMSVSRPFVDRDFDRQTREIRPSRVSSETGDVVQTMCVRSCDGYYWPVRYPATHADFNKDANVCSSTCGAEAKLYFRSGPGAAPEDMKDVAGNSYVATKTAFAYRKGLVKGCSCRSMPWSEVERARHEGYALAEAEKALRVAEAEAQRVAAAAIAVEKAASAKRHEQLAAVVMEADAQRDTRGFEPGPAEAAAIAGFSAVKGDAVTAVDVVAKSKRSAARERRRARHVSVEPVSVQRARLPRSYVGSGARPAAPRYAASAPKAWWQ